MDLGFCLDLFGTVMSDPLRGSWHLFCIYSKLRSLRSLAWSLPQDAVSDGFPFDDSRILVGVYSVWSVGAGAKYCAPTGLDISFCGGGWKHGVDV